MLSGQLLLLEEYLFCFSQIASTKINGLQSRQLLDLAILAKEMEAKDRR